MPACKSPAFPGNGRRSSTSTSQDSTPILFRARFGYSFPSVSGKSVATNPAMASGLTDHVWTVKDIVALMDPVAARVE